MPVKKLTMRSLPASFLLIGLFSVIASLIYMTSEKLSVTWGMLFLVTGIIFIAASLKSLGLQE